MLYRYAIGLGVDFPDDPHALALQSAMAGMVGLTAVENWRYACHNRRLLSDHIRNDEARKLQLAFLTEPVTASITIPLAFTGRLHRDLARLSYPLAARLLGRWKRKTKAA